MEAVTKQSCFVAVIEHANDGSFSAYVPDLPGCTASSDTADGVRVEIAEAIRLHVESLRMNGEPVPSPSAEAIRVSAA